MALRLTGIECFQLTRDILHPVDDTVGAHASKCKNHRADGSVSGSCSRSFAGSRSEIAVEVISAQRSPSSWAARMLHHISSGDCRQALRIYEEMREGGVKLSSYTFVAALKACGKLRDLEAVKRIHAEAARRGFESHLYVGTMLVDVYGKCGSLIDARRVFEKMPSKTVVSWNAMILGHAQMEQGEVALKFYEQMQQENVLPTDRTFIAALKACSSLATSKDRNDVDGMSAGTQSLLHVKSIHIQIVKSGLESVMFVGTMLVDAYAKCGSLVDARLIFERMSRRDVVAWNAMIMGYAQVEEGAEALRLYSRMQLEGVFPDDRTFVGALRACSSLHLLEDRKDTEDVLVKQQHLERVRAIHSEIVKCGCEADVFVSTMLVDTYAKYGSLAEARHVFKNMPHRTVVSWNAMILGHAQMEEGEEALKLYAWMQDEGAIPNDRTFVGALKACSVVSGLEKGKQIHARIHKMGVQVTGSVLATCLIDMYAKCGSMQHAKEVFDTVPRKDVVTWSALIAGYALQGESDRVFALFQSLKEEGLRPNGITFLSVLTACSHAGMVDKGQSYFEDMRIYGVTPTVDHYTCMVDLLGRAGQLEKALAIVRSMPLVPDAAVWQSLLGACQKWRNLELARQAFECAVMLGQDDAAVYVLMSNIYAAVGMMENARKTRDMRVNRCVWKGPTQSWWTDPDGTVYAFAVKDTERYENRSILRMTDETKNSSFTHPSAVQSFNLIGT